MTTPEHTAQATVFQWSALHEGRYPELRLMHASLNGAALKGGARTWKYLAAAGAKAGVPDFFLPCARGGYHGLFIEMKVGSNKPRENQVEWLDALHEQGYQALVCYSASEAIEAITAYLESGSTSY